MKSTRLLVFLCCALSASCPELTQAQTNQTIPSLSLEQALRRAELTHPELVKERALVAAFEGRTQQAGKLPNPEAIVRVESARLDGRTTGDADYLAGVSQTIPLGNRLALERTAAQRELDNQQSLVAARALAVRQRIHAAFATALYQEHAFKSQSNLQENLAKTVTIAKARLEAGDATPDEVARAEMEKVRTGVELARAKAMRDQSMLALAVAIGEPKTAIESLTGSLETTFALPALESLLVKLAGHPVMAAGSSELLAKDARIKLAEAQRIPDVKVDLLYRRIESEKRNAIDLGFSIPLPLFDRNQGRIKEAKAEREVSRANAVLQQNDLAARLRSAYADLKAALAINEAIKTDMLPRAETILKTAEARYAAGDISLNEILPLRRDSVAVRLAHLESLRETFQAWSALQEFVQ